MIFIPFKLTEVALLIWSTLLDLSPSNVTPPGTPEASIVRSRAITISDPFSG